MLYSCSSILAQSPWNNSSKCIVWCTVDCTFNWTWTTFIIICKAKGIIFYVITSLLWLTSDIIPIKFYQRSSNRVISDIAPRPLTFYQNDLSMNTADLTGDKPIAVWSLSISDLSVMKPLVTFYIHSYIIIFHGRKREVFYLFSVCPAHQSLRHWMRHYEKWYNNNSLNPENILNLLKET
jgi:hypothetical protein